MSNRNNYPESKSWIKSSAIFYQIAFQYIINRFCLVAVGFNLFYFSGTSQTGIEKTGLLPASNHFKNWSIKDSVEVFKGENLFSYIDGGADLYLEYGFDEVATCKYVNFAATSIHVEIYRMTSDSAAFGIFTINSSEKGKTVSFVNKALLYDYYLDFWKGSFFVRCSASRKDSAVMDTLMLFAQLVDGNIRDKGKEPGLTYVLLVENMEFNNIKYIRGLIGLGNVFNFGHGAIAGFSDGVVGYSKDKMVFTFGYSNDHKCREWFACAKGKMQMNQKFTDFDQKENGFTIKDKAGTDFCFVAYKRFIVIIKGIGWEAAQPVLDQIRTNIDTL
jgi:hypothetical protein